MNRWILLLCGLLAGCQYSHKQEGGRYRLQDPRNSLFKEKMESVELPYPGHDFDFKEGNTFVPRFTSEDGRYLIGYEVQEKDENPVIIWQNIKQATT